MDRKHWCDPLNICEDISPWLPGHLFGMMYECHGTLWLDLPYQFRTQHRWVKLFPDLPRELFGASREIKKSFYAIIDKGLGKLGAVFTASGRKCYNAYPDSRFLIKNWQRSDA